MKEQRVITAGPNTFLVCIDDVTDGVASGVAYNGYQTESRPFHSLMDFVQAADAAMDEGAFPQAAFRRRGFFKPTLRGDGVEFLEKRRGLERRADPETLFHRRGQYGTFWITVLYRRNASWQGVAGWVPDQKMGSARTILFRSVLELVLAMREQIEREKEGVLAPCEDKKRSGPAR